MRGEKGEGANFTYSGSLRSRPRQTTTRGDGRTRPAVHSRLSVRSGPERQRVRFRRATTRGQKANSEELHEHLRSAEARGAAREAATGHRADV